MFNLIAIGFLAVSFDFSFARAEFDRQHRLEEMLGVTLSPIVILYPKFNKILGRPRYSIDKSGYAHVNSKSICLCFRQPEIIYF
jgi:hypothetical protein